MDTAGFSLTLWFSRNTGRVVTRNMPGTISSDRMAVVEGEGRPPAVVAVSERGAALEGCE